MHRSREDLGDLIEAAALDMSLWPDVLAGLAEAVGAEGAALVYQSQATGRGASVTVGIDPAATPLYFGEFADRNPLQRANGLLEKIQGFRPKILNDEHLLPKADLTGTDFYQGVLRPFGMHSIMMIGLGVRDVHRVGINLVRPTGRPQFAEPELKSAARWHEGLMRAFDVGMAVSPLAAVNADLIGILDTLTDAVFLVDGEARVIFRNRRADELAAAGDLLGMTGGRLRAAYPEQARRLEALIAQAIARGPFPARGAAMALRAPNRRLPLSLTVTPLAPRRTSIFEAPLSAMVRVCDVESALPLAEQRMADLFGLTRAEARVAAALFEGLAPRDAAERLGVSFHTVRGQLVRIFEKTGVTRQAELVRLMARLVEPLH